MISFILYAMGAAFQTRWCKNYSHYYLLYYIHLKVSSSSLLFTNLLFSSLIFSSLLFSWFLGYLHLLDTAFLFPVCLLYGGENYQQESNHLRRTTISTVYLDINHGPPLDQGYVNYIMCVWLQALPKLLDKPYRYFLKINGFYIFFFSFETWNFSIFFLFMKIRFQAHFKVHRGAAEKKEQVSSFNEILLIKEGNLFWNINYSFIWWATLLTNSSYKPYKNLCFRIYLFIAPRRS